MKPIRFLQPAELELLEAAHFYELRATGLGGYFLDEVNKALESIRASPNRHPIINHDHGVRRYLIQRFPYALLYRIDADAIIIQATMHLRRRPDYWMKR